MSEEIDWAKLAADLGCGEHGGGDEARRALELVIGEDVLRASVDYYVAYRRGYELARSVLWQLRPWSAMSRCYEIFKGPETVEARRTAVELLRVVADRRALPWIPEFLQDPDALIQAWGAGVLDQLLWAQLVEPEEAEDLLKVAERHENEVVRERGELVRGYLLARSEAETARGLVKGNCGE